MGNLTPARRAALQKELGEVEAELKQLHQRFGDIKKRAMGARSGAASRRDAREIDQIRKQLGLG